MRTTLNLPDELVRRAKEIARSEGTTLTRLIVDGLEYRVGRDTDRTELPVSSESGGVIAGVSWMDLDPIEPADEHYR